MSAALTQILPPDLLEQARHLEAWLLRPVQGSGHGRHRSRTLGGGSEFSEYKGYSPGDDVRHLDWKVAARSDRLVVRQFESDRRCDVHLVLDRSGSMSFGTTARSSGAPWGGEWPTSKWELARLLSLTLGFVFLRGGDRVGLSLADGTSSLPSQARGGRKQLPELAHRILERGPVGQGDLQAVLGDLVFRASTGLLVLVSDLLQDESILPALRAHVARGTEVWVLHVVDPAEVEFPYDEPTRFIDLETAEEMGLNPREFARAYREEFQAFMDVQERDCAHAGIRYMRLRTDERFDRQVVEFLKR